MKFFGWILLLSLGIAVYGVMLRHVTPYDDLSRAQYAGQIAALLVAMGVAFVPSLRRRFDRVVSNKPQPRLSIAIAVISVEFFVVSAHVQRRFGAPAIHDEQMFHTQATLLAHGRLWMPEHPLADFFQTFHILVKPVYAPMSFPGTAIFYVPAIWTGLPLWIISVLIAGGVVAMIHRVGTEIFDRRIGLIAAVLAAATPGARVQSIETLAYLPAILLELAVVWAWLQWRKSGQMRWALLAGCFAGWALITRPVDALCFVVPVGGAVVWRMWKLPGRIRWTTAVAAITAALPFIGVQLVFDRGVTGHFFQTPFSLGLIQEDPGLQFSLARHFDPTARPVSHLPQIQEYYTDWLLPMLKTDHAMSLPILWLRNLANVSLESLPTPKLLIFLPAGLAALASGPGTILLVAFPLFLLFYGFYGVFIGPYGLVPLATMVIAIAAAPRVIGFSRVTRSALCALVVALSLAALLPAKPQPPSFAELPAINRLLAKYVRPPAIVLFRYGPGSDIQQEPVYNPDVCSPDEAPIIRAQYLGKKRDIQLFRYYAARQPRRMVYLYLRGSGELIRLGRVTRLAAGKR